MSAELINLILKALPGDGIGLSLCELAAAIGRSREQTAKAAGRMVSRKLAERLPPDGAPRRTRRKSLAQARGRYRLTALGVTARDAGKAVTTGPRGPHTGPRKVERASLRARVWRALRQLEKATIAELVTMAATDAERDARQNAAKFVYALANAGVVVALRRRSAGNEVRYFLARDLGPKPPVVRQAAGRRGQLFDPNSGTVVFDPAREVAS